MVESKYWDCQVSQYRKNEKGALKLGCIRRILIKDSRKNNSLMPMGTLIKSLGDGFISNFSTSVTEVDKKESEILISLKNLEIKRINISD